VSPGVIGDVLLGALLHAGWNAIVKSGTDKLLDTVLVASGTAVIGATVLAFVSLPDAGSWPYIAGSAAIHVVYFLLVASAYRLGDMSYAYPLMRGSAPLVLALFSAALFGERLTAAGWAGVVLICGGVLALAIVCRDPARTAAEPTAFALANALVIAAYTSVDGLGVRLSGDPAAYTVSVFVLDVPPLVLWALWRRPARQVLRHVRTRWAWGLAGGAATLTSYGLSLWAMTQAPIAAVAALRETSVLFGVVIAGALLGERFGPLRYAAAATIVVGTVALRLG
jgi:drug/metabolite transporter (DMT)-like permease